jgi:hypothetical protein
MYELFALMRKPNFVSKGFYQLKTTLASPNFMQGEYSYHYTCPCLLEESAQ